MFALHRIESDPIVALVALRVHEDGAFDPAPFAVLELGGLDGTTAAELLGRRAPIQADVAEACVTSVGGNPLALMELDRTLDAAQRDGRRPLDDPPPVGAALARLVGRRIVSLSADSRAALVVVALGAPFPESLPELLNRLELDIRSLDEPERAGIVNRGRVVEFAHPLLRAAVLDGVEPAQRRRTHRMLANVFAAAGDEDRAAWHLGSAADGPDTVAAAALEAAGARALAWRGHRRGCGIRERGTPDGCAVRAGPSTLPGRSRGVGCRRADAASRCCGMLYPMPIRSTAAEYVFPLGMAIGWNTDMRAGIELLREEGERVADDFPRGGGAPQRCLGAPRDAGSTAGRGGAR